LNTANFIPFEAITYQIEDYLYGLISLGDIVVYLCSRILLFLPYGYQMTLLMRKQGRLVRLSALLVLPFLLEVLQYIIIPSRFDIDDLIYALIGGVLGSLLFYLSNLVFRACTGKNFLAKENDYSYSNSKVHF
jgi:glycopeptide antibiotics resistance protein